MVKRNRPAPSAGGDGGAAGVCGGGLGGDRNILVKSYWSNLTNHTKLVKRNLGGDHVDGGVGMVDLLKAERVALHALLPHLDIVVYIILYLYYIILYCYYIS